MKLEWWRLKYYFQVCLSRISCYADSCCALFSTATHGFQEFTHFWNLWWEKDRSVNLQHSIELSHICLVQIMIISPDELLIKNCKLARGQSCSWSINKSILTAFLSDIRYQVEVTFHLLLNNKTHLSGASEEEVVNNDFHHVTGYRHVWIVLDNGGEAQYSEWKLPNEKKKPGGSSSKRTYSMEVSRSKRCRPFFTIFQFQWDSGSVKSCALTHLCTAERISVRSRTWCLRLPVWPIKISRLFYTIKVIRRLLFWPWWYAYS